MHVRPKHLGTTLLALLLPIAAGCSSDTSSTSGGPSTTIRSTSADHSPTSRVVAPKRSSFATSIGTVRLPCEGSGRIPVILVAGTDDPVERWNDLVERAGQGVLLCRFAPPIPSQAPITPTALADALADTLDASGLPGPYVLVGHSLGGLTVRQFGAEHGDLLGGALLLDATTPVALQSLHTFLEPDWDVPATQADADAAVTWPDVPLIVFSHDPSSGALGLGPTVEMLWIAGQEAYAELSRLGTFEQVEGSGHYIDHDAPNAVIQAIDRLVLATGS